MSRVKVWEIGSMKRKQRPDEKEKHSMHEVNPRNNEQKGRTPDGCEQSSTCEKVAPRRPLREIATQLLKLFRWDRWRRWQLCPPLVTAHRQERECNPPQDQHKQNDCEDIHDMRSQDARGDAPKLSDGPVSALNAGEEFPASSQRMDRRCGHLELAEGMSSGTGTR